MKNTHLLEGRKNNTMNHTWLCDACKAGNLDEVRERLSKHPELLYAVDGKGRSALYFACMSSSVDLVRYIMNLLLAAPRPTKCWDKGNTVLHYACAHGTPELVDYLLDECHVDMEVVNDQGATPFHSACNGGSFDVVRHLVGRGVNVHARSVGEWTGLHFACRYSPHLSTVRFLVEEVGVPIDVQTNHGRTPLDLACARHDGRTDFVEYLVGRCVDNACMHDTLHACLCFACVSGASVEIVSWILRRDPSLAGVCKGTRSPLWLACKAGKLDLVRILVDSGADVRVLSKRGWNLLHVASEQGWPEIVVYLVRECGMDIDARTSDTDETAFLIASRFGKTLVVKQLVTMGANIRAVSSIRGFNTLHGACEPTGSAETVQYLMAIAKDLSDGTDKDGNLPFHIACWAGREDVVRLFLGKYEFDKLHWGMMLASSAGHIDVFSLLAKHDPELVNGRSAKNHFTPFMQAVLKGHVAVAKRLVELGARWQIDRMPNGGTDALHLACQTGSLPMVRYLVKELECAQNHEDSRKWMPIHEACSEPGRVEILKCLRPEVADDSSCPETPLHIACRLGVTDSIEFMMSERPRFFTKWLQKQDSSRTKPFARACAEGRLDIIKLLWPKVGINIQGFDDLRKEGLVTACSNGHLDTVRFLVKNDRRSMERLWSSDLQTAVENKHVDVLRYLIRNKCDMPRTSKGTLSPLVAALVAEEERWERRRRMLFWTQGRRAIVEVSSVGRRLMDACEANNVETARELIEICPTSVYCLRNGRTPFLVACRAGSRECAELLLANAPPRASRNVWRVKSYTPARDRAVYEASERGHDAVVEWLLSFDSTGDFESLVSGSDERLFPLHLATANGHIGVVRVLLKADADVNLEDDEARTALVLGVANDQWDIAKLLLENGADARPGLLIPDRGHVLRERMRGWGLAAGEETGRECPLCRKAFCVDTRDAWIVCPTGHSLCLECCVTVDKRRRSGSGQCPVCWCECIRSPIRNSALMALLSTKF